MTEATNSISVAAEQNACMIEQHNAFGKPTDLVCFVGDIVCKSNPESIPQIAKKNGRKWLFRGNYDVFSEAQLNPYYFEPPVPLRVAGGGCISAG